MDEKKEAILRARTDACMLVGVGAPYSSTGIIDALVVAHKM